MRFSFSNLFSFVLGLLVSAASTFGVYKFYLDPNIPPSGVNQVKMPDECKAFTDLKSHIECATDADCELAKSCLDLYKHNLLHFNVYTLGNGALSRNDVTTSARSYYTYQNPNSIFSHLRGSDAEPRPLGGSLIKMDDDEAQYIAFEAPHGSDIFADMAWNYGITTYITLTQSDADNDPVKLSIYRGTSDKRIDFHHLDKMSGKFFAYEYFVSNLKQKNFPGKPFLLLSANLGRFNESRPIYQFKTDALPDNNLSKDYNSLLEFVKVVREHHLEALATNPNLKNVIAVNCFAELHRTKLFILGLHAYEKHLKGEYVNLEHDLVQYQDYAFGKLAKSYSEKAHAWKKMKSFQSAVLKDLYDTLNRATNEGRKL